MTLAETIKGFIALEYNWNGYEAVPFSDKVISRALMVAKVFEGTGFQVFPTGRNSIQFEKEVDGSYVEIEVFEDREECLTTAST